MQAPTQPTPLAPYPRPGTEPHCLVWFPGDPCDQAIQQYRQAIAEQQRNDWQSAVTARYEKQFADQQKKIADQQKQIADQHTQITLLQSKIESQTMEALRSEARTQAFYNGIGVVIGIGVAFLLVMAAYRKLARNASEPTHEQGRAASA
jgi:hypothetical protein